MALFRFIALLALVSPASAALQEARLAVNPIRRVVTMLQMMQKKVEEEGKAEAKLFEQFMCWCKTGGGDLKKAIADAEDKIPRLEKALEEDAAELTQLKSDVEKANADRAEAKKTLAEAKGMREKEAAAFAKESSELKTNIAALGKAIAALEKGVEGGFLQTSAAATLRRLTIDMELSNVDRDTLTSFLSQGQGSGYAPQSGQIIGILKQMKETMEKTLADATAEENKAIADFDALTAAKEKEVAACGEEIETKTKRIGEIGVDIVNMKEDLDDTKKAMEADKKFLADLEKNCATKKDEWAARSKTRAEELLALADTIKILNDDDALELFKKTLPSPSFLQTHSTKEIREHSLSALKVARKKDFRLNLIAMALKGRKVSFDKVIGMIDDMVALLGKEQVDDDKKKEWCEAELDKSEDKHKELELKVSDLVKANEEIEDAIKTLTDELATLAAGIVALDKEVAEASAERKEEHAEFVSTLAANNAAKELLAFAKNRLQKFYNPKLYVPPPERELTEEQRITKSMGGSLAPTDAPGGIAGTGISALAQVAPAPPPETWGAYQKKGQESAGVMSLMDMLTADLDKETQEMQVDEKNAQEEYEQFMEDSATKRADDSKSIADKETTKSEAEVNLQTVKKEKKATMLEAMATAKVISELHADCDWLLSNFDARKAARAGEIDSLKKAKAVLSGADYSLVQTARAHLRGTFN